MNPAQRRGLRIACAALLLLLLMPQGWVLARVGGGQSYGGGGSGGGAGGGGDGGGFLVYLLIRLIVTYPEVGIPVTVLVIIAYAMRRRAGADAQPVAVGGVLWKEPEPQAGGSMDALKQVDPNFSGVLFLDFVQLVFTRFHQLRGGGEPSSLKPYLDPLVYRGLVRSWEEGRQRSLSVRDIIIGESRVGKIRVTGKLSALQVLFEANLTESSADRGPVTLLIKEGWTFLRKTGVVSRTPETILALDCPSCGAAVSMTADDRCEHCGNLLNDGSFHWVVDSISVYHREPVTVVKPKRGHKEPGTERPTIFQPGYARHAREFMLRTPGFSWPSFKKKVSAVFHEIQQAWASQEWERSRPFVTDHLFQIQRYWIENYRRSGLVNVVQEERVDQIIPVRIDRDAFYDAITVRVFASMIDFTKDSEGRVVSGSRSARNDFSEYWTFVRRSAFRQGKGTEHDQCPNCAAPLSLNMAGICSYCGGKITSGEFDWVLSSIEQDEAYKG